MVLVTEGVGHSPLAAGTALWHSQEAADSKSAAFWYLYGCEDIGHDNDFFLRLPGLSGNGICPGRLYAVTEEEVWRHIELHASLAHNEDPATWSDEDINYLKGLVRSGIIAS